MTDVVTIAKQIIAKQLDEIMDDAVQKMKAEAPYPTGASRGKGSMATGKTKSAIHAEKTGEWSAFIGVDKSQIPYAEYANSGRGAISGKFMVFRGSDGRIHKTRYVAPMEGWHFVEETMDYIKAKYNGR